MARKQQRRRFHLIVLVATFLLLLGRGAVAQTEPGKLVSIGPVALQLHCTGSGGPTVVIETGLGDFLSDWELVRRPVEKAVHICTYDRGGYGSSQLSDAPRTLAQLNLELHTLLQASGEKPPYLLVGHSFGGLVVRSFAARYPGEVAGMVLAESVTEHQPIVFGGQAHYLKDFASGKAIPEPHLAAAKSYTDPKSPPAELEKPYAVLPRPLQELHRRFAAASSLNDAESSQREWSSEYLADWDRHPQRNLLQDRPLIVLTRADSGYDASPNYVLEEVDARRLRAQTELLQLSRNSIQLVVPYGHNLHLEAPDVVAAAIQLAVQSARSSAPVVAVQAGLSGPGAEDLPDDTKLFEGLENEMMTAFARGDRPALERLIGDEYQLTSATSTGGRIGKQNYISGGLSQIVVRSFHFHDLSVQRFGDVAIVYCRLDWQSTWGGREWSADFLMTDVWVQRRGAWQIVSRHSSYPEEPGRARNTESAGVAAAQQPAEGFADPAPATDAYVVSRGVPYRASAGAPVLADIYRPTTRNGAPSAVLIFMNTRGPSSLRNHPIYLGWGRAAAAEGFVAIVPDASADGEEKDFDGILDYVRRHATELVADPEQVGVYAASGNGNGLALAEEPKRTMVRAAAIYYGVVPELKTYRPDLPVLLVRAGLDRPSLNRAIDVAVQAALAQNAPFTLLNYPAGHHGFEQLDQNEASREVIRQTLGFFKTAFSPAYQAALRQGVPAAEAAGALARGDFGQASHLYGRLVTEQPGDPLLRLSYGEALLGAGEIKHAREQFERLRGAGLGPRDLALPAARAAALDGDADAAVAWLKTIPSPFLPSSLANDPAFEKMRDRPDFRGLFQPAK